MADILDKQFIMFEKYSGGTLGVCALHLETDREIKFNADQFFSMCSIYKVPIAIYLLHQVELGHIDLSEIYTIKETDLRPGYAFTLNDFDVSSGFPISLRNLLLMMLRESCNTSTDILLYRIGGPQAVTDYLLSLGFKNIRIDRYTLEIIAALEGVKTLPENLQCTLSQYKALEKAVSNNELVEAKEQFKHDKRDSASPEAMTQLLTKLFKQALLNAAHTNWLLTTMRRNKLYPNRLMGLLPHHTPVAHKTGSAHGYTNDVGIITLPHDLGHIAISAFIKESSKEKSYNERTLAEVSRTVYDYFLFK